MLLNILNAHDIPFAAKNHLLQNASSVITTVLATVLYYLSVPPVYSIIYPSTLGEQRNSLQCTFFRVSFTMTTIRGWNIRVHQVPHKGKN